MIFLGLLEAVEAYVDISLEGFLKMLSIGFWRLLCGLRQHITLSRGASS